MQIDKDLTFKDENGHLVVIMSHIVQRIMRYRQLHHLSKEAAGVLIGERRGPHLIICDISEPGSGDVRDRFNVDRKGPHHQEKVTAAFVTSGGTLQYLGEWHTHPEDDPTPSSKDYLSWCKIDASRPVTLLIVGRKRLWIGIKEHNQLKTLSELRETSL